MQTGRGFLCDVEHALNRNGYQMFELRAPGAHPALITPNSNIYYAEPSIDVTPGFLYCTQWQQMRGSVQYNIPFQILCLNQALHYTTQRANRAYMVLGGPGWRSDLLEFYLSDSFPPCHHFDSNIIKVINWESFVAQANKQLL